MLLTVSTDAAGALAVSIKGDFLPATHGMLALREVFIGGAGLHEIAFRLGMTAVLLALYFALGVIVFERRQMRHGG